MAEVDKLCEILSLLEIESLNKNLSESEDPKSVFFGVIEQANFL